MKKFISLNQKETLFAKVEFSSLAKVLSIDSTRLRSMFLTQLVKQLTLMLSALPPSTKIVELIGEVINSFQQLIEKIDQEFSGESRISEMEDDIRNTTEQQNIIDDQITDHIDIIRQLKGAFDDWAEILRPKALTWKRFRITLFLFLTIDVLFNFTNFEVLGLSQLVSIAASALLAIGLYFYVDQTPRIIRKIHNRYGVRKLVLAVVALIPPVALFSLLSSLREQYAISMDNGVAPGSSVVFIGINTFILLVSFIIVWRYKLNSEEQDRLDVYNQVKKKIEKEEQTIAELKKQHIELGDVLRKRNTIRYNAFQAIASLESQVKLNYQTTCSELKTSLLFKSNGKAAFLFTNDETDFPPLQLKYQNIPELFKKYSTDREVFRTAESASSSNRLLLFLLPLVILIASCTSPKSSHIKIVTDQSDSMRAVAQFVNDSTAVTSLSQHHKPEEKQTISVDYITDRRLSEDGLRLTLAAGKIPLLDNDIDRKTEIELFRSNSKLIQRHIQKKPIGLNGSFIFYHVHRCLNELIQEQNNFSAAYVFTDAVEQSPWLDLYNQTEFNLFISNADFRHSILDTFPLDSIDTSNRVELHFIYQGKDKADDERFHTIIEAVAPYYLKHGIHVFTGRSISGTKPLANIKSPKSKS